MSTTETEQWLDSGVSEQDGENCGRDGWSSIGSYIALHAGVPKIKSYRLDPVSKMYQYSLPTKKDMMECEIDVLRKNIPVLTAKLEMKTRDFEYVKNNLKISSIRVSNLQTEIAYTQRVLELFYEPTTVKKDGDKQVVDWFHNKQLRLSRKLDREMGTKMNVQDLLSRNNLEVTKNQADVANAIETLRKAEESYLKLYGEPFCNFYEKTLLRRE